MAKRLQQYLTINYISSDRVMGSLSPRLDGCNETGRDRGGGGGGGEGLLGAQPKLIIMGAEKHKISTSVRNCDASCCN